MHARRIFFLRFSRMRMHFVRRRPAVKRIDSAFPIASPFPWVDRVHTVVGNQKNWIYPRSVLAPESSDVATARSLQKEVRTITGGGTQSPTITIPKALNTSLK
ncbi:hypothetical protein AVEN_242273-1 [Araneus ventricosus]|uniref:Uncharacterized protein n=1 Tax=Araneus ventricosus TaxID=182803 RepID=A0A4Y2NWW6_ARAVE|nr:hypothetical protein AVEN_242273-1 [Araneus ventricosus]